MLEEMINTIIDNTINGIFAFFFEAGIKEKINRKR